MEHTAEAEDWQTSTGLQFHVLRADKPFYFARGVAHNDIDNCNLIVMAAGYSYEDYYAILDILIPITGKDHLLAWLQEIDWQER